MGERERESVCVYLCKRRMFAGSALQVVSASVSETDGERARERNFFLHVCVYVCVCESGGGGGAVGICVYKSD